MRKIIIFLMTFFLVLNIGYARIDYTYNTKHTTNKDKSGNIIIHSGIRYANDKGKLIEDAPSLVDCQFCNHINLIITEDTNYNIEIFDFNSTSISLQLYINSPFLINKDINLEVYDKDNSSKKYLNTFKKLDTIYDSRQLIIPFGFDKVVKWGLNSTTIYINGTTGEGSIRERTNIDWNTVHDDTSSSYGQDTDVRLECYFTGTWWYIKRAFIPYNTSILNDDIAITEATVHAQIQLILDDDDDGLDYAVLVGETTQGSFSSLSAADFNDCGLVDNPNEYSQHIDWSSYSANEWMIFNITDRTIINLTGITKIGIREGHDVEDIACDGPYNLVEFYNIEDGGYSVYLNITYSEPASDTCSCPSGSDWIVDASDNCILSTNCDITGYDFYINGIGSFTLLANLTADMVAIESGVVFSNTPNDGKQLQVAI